MPEKYDLEKLWVNRYMDFSAFLDYRKEGVLTYCGWRKSIKGEKIYPDAWLNDPLPFFYEFGFGRKFIRLPGYIYKKLFR
jgi:hypothetical protein